MPPIVRPPTVDPLVALADRCVQCGLCLPACPTYGHDRVEAESPRGRIALMRAWAIDAIEPTPAGDAHLDHCLACHSCEAVCPAGVKYGELLVGARGRQRERRGAGLRQRLIERLSARPRLLASVLSVYRYGYRWLPARLRSLPRPPRPVRSPPPLVKPATDRDHVALFVGCVAAPYEAALRTAVARLCAPLSVEIVEPAGQTCCGSLHAHAGNTAEAQRLAARNRRALAHAGTVLTLASGCHESLAAALAGDARTIDAIAFIAARGDTLRWRECRERIALHLPCTQRNVLKSVDALRRLLARVPGLVVVELDAGFGCCGAAGTQMLTDPARADDYRRPLLAQFDAAGATRLLSANIGCRLHFANATPRPVQHPLEFLAGLLDDAPAPVAFPVDHSAEHSNAVTSTP
ncbi:MAG: (Fe-S)-binding protein [Lysobacter sp.]